MASAATTDLIEAKDPDMPPHVPPGRPPPGKPLPEHPPEPPPPTHEPEEPPEVDPPGAEPPPVHSGGRQTIWFVDDQSA